MKSRTLVVASLLVLAAGNLLAGEISRGSLSKMGLGNVKAMSDREGTQVRGSGSFVVIAGFASTFAGAPASYLRVGTTAQGHSVSSVGAFGSSAGGGSFVVVH